MRYPRRAAILALLAVTGAAATAGPAVAETPTLLCARDEVLRIVDRTVRRWNQYNRIVEGTAVEAPTTVANAVVCHAVMATVGYVLTPEGWVARPVQETRRYDVQVIGNRLFVQVAP